MIETAETGWLKPKHRQSSAERRGGHTSPLRQKSSETEVGKYQATVLCTRRDYLHFLYSAKQVKNAVTRNSNQNVNFFVLIPIPLGVI